MLFRSDHLNDLSDDDLACVTGLGLRRVHDFRLPSERERQPSRLPDGVEVRHLAALDLHHDETMIDVIQDMLAGRRPMPPPETWDDNYGAMVEGLRPMFCALVDSLADASTVTTPALFHCTGGKDRTGVAGVVLLELLGVPRELAIDDFLLTNVYRTPTRVELLRDQLAAVNITVAEALPVIGVTRSAITRAQHVIDTDFGGVERYVLEGGAQPDAPARLRELLVERS